MVKKIPLSGGRTYAIVDDDDYEWLSKNKWSDDGLGYAIRKVKGKSTTEKMYRLIMDVSSNKQIDHINGIPYDNRKENLRVVNNQQNSFNRDKYGTNKTGYKGVAVYKNNRFTAQITYNYKKIHLGCFDSPTDAAKAYNDAAINYFGEYAKLNEI